MTKYALLLPFFGSLPFYFDCWAKSCEMNHDRFHWYVYSDHITARQSYNQAVTLIPCTFEEMTADFQTVLNITLPGRFLRNVCDYRLMFYFLRRDREPLDEYDFIGYTDMDMIYGRLHRFMPEQPEQYAMISGDEGHPCGPFTLIRKDCLPRLLKSKSMKQALDSHEYLGFDESPELMETIAGGQPVWCRSEALQPMMSKEFNHRRHFGIWDQGRVIVKDNRGHKKEGGFYHFSRFKNKPRFRIENIERHKSWAVCKFGVFPIRSFKHHMKLWLSLYL